MEAGDDEHQRAHGEPGSSHCRVSNRYTVPEYLEEEYGGARVRPGRGHPDQEWEVRSPVDEHVGPDNIQPASGGWL